MHHREGRRGGFTTGTQSSQSFSFTVAASRSQRLRGESPNPLNLFVAAKAADRQAFLILFT